MIPAALRRMDAATWLFAAVALALAALVVLPLAWIARYALTGADGSPTAAHLVQLATDPALRGPFAAALGIALASAALATVVALPLAWLVARTDVPGRSGLRALATASFVTPPFLGAVAWELLAAPNSGLLNAWARWAFGWDEFDYLFDIYTPAGVAFCIACYTFPYVFTLLANGLESIPADIEDASHILGAGAWATARRVTVPLVLPAIAAGSLVCFLQALTIFGTPAILALPAGFHTLTTKIWSLFQYPPKTNLAAATSVPLLLITLAVLAVQRRLLGRRGYATIGGKNSQPRTVRLGPWRWPALGLCLGIMAAPVFLPYAALIKAAMVERISDPLSWATLSARHLRFVLWEFSGTRPALANTLALGVASATLVTAAALVVAYLASRRLAPGSRFLPALAMAPIAVPGIVMGVGLFLVYSRSPFLLYGTLWILVLGFVTLEMPAGFQQVQAAMRGLHVELEEAARIFGATRLGALRGIVAPLMRSTVIATWSIVFIATVRELSATILLTTSETKVISVVIYDLNESGEQGAIAVMGLTLLAATFAVVWGVNRLPILGGPQRFG